MATKVPTFACTAQNTIQENLSILLAQWTIQIWQVEFIQLTPSHQYKYGWVAICMFSHWATDCSMTKILLENIIST